MQDVFVVLLLIIAANGAPILVRFILREYLSLPVDFHRSFFDGKRIFGNSKTWAGLVSIPIMSVTAALILGMETQTGVLIGTGVMLGDLFSSFTKRRLGMKESSMAFGLDQIPESLFPYLLVTPVFDFTLLEIVIGIVSFIVIELLVSRVLFWLHVRKQPY
ncbi:CDP-archaeol synthase [Kaarinaea lacus]